MKKLFVILLAILLFVCCTSCAKKSNDISGSLQLNSSSSEINTTSSSNIKSSTEISSITSSSFSEIGSSSFSNTDSFNDSLSSSLIESSSIKNSSSSEINTFSSFNTESFSDGLSNNKQSSSISSNISSSSLESSSSQIPLYSYSVTIDPESESKYIPVKMYLNGVEVTNVQAGEKVTIVITSSDAVRRSIGVVAINGTTVFSSTTYEQEVKGTVTMKEGGLQIYVKLILQNNYS